MVVDLARVYRQDVDIDAAVRLLGELGKNLLAILGVSAVTPAVASIVAVKFPPPFSVSAVAVPPVTVKSLSTNPVTTSPKAIVTWKFEALKAGSTGEQWGTVTFNYRLSDAE